MKKLILLFAVALVSCETKNVTITETEFSVSGRSLKTYELDAKTGYSPIKEIVKTQYTQLTNN